MPSIVRNNLLTRRGYTPYCGNEDCMFMWPRSRFNRGQFECPCGWRSGYEPEFIAKYQAAQAALQEKTR